MKIIWALNIKREHLSKDNGHMDNLVVLERKDN